MIYSNSDKGYPIEDFSAGLRTTGTFFSRIQTSPKAMNAMSGKGRSLKKRPGFANEILPGIGTAPITGMYEYGISREQRKQLMHTGTNVYKMDELDGNWHLLQTGISENTTSEFETFTTSSGNILLHCTHNNDALRYWDGDASTMSLVSGSGVPAPKYIKVWNNHVWAAGIIGNPSRLRYSNVASYTAWQTNSVDNYDDNFQTSDGDYITGLAVLRGNLYVFKRYHIFRVTYLGGTPLISVLKVISGTGCISNKSIVEAEVSLVDQEGTSKRQVLIFMTADKKIVAFDGAVIYPMSEVISEDNFHSEINMGSLNDSQLEECHAIYLAEKDAYVLFVANLSNAEVSHALVLDTTTRGIFPWDNMNFRSSAVFVTSGNKKIPYVGGYDGQAYRLMYGSKDVTPTLVTGLKALLHLDGKDDQTVITDYMGSLWTANGGASLDQSQAKFGKTSLLLDGTDDYISTPTSTDWDFSGGTWTVDCQVRPASLASDMVIWSQTTDASNYMNCILLSTGEVKFEIVTATVATVSVTTSSASITTGAWFHIEVIESGNTYKIFVNGTERGSGTDADRPLAYAGAFEFGRLGVGTPLYFNGWIDEIRVLKGVAANTATFTAPTVEYPSRTFANVEIGFEYELDLIDSKRADAMKKGRHILVHLKPRSNTTITLSRAMQFEGSFHTSTRRSYVANADAYPLGNTSGSFVLNSSTLGAQFGATLVYDLPDSYNHFRLRIEESSTLESFEIHRIDIVQSLEGLASNFYSGVVTS